MLNPFAPEPPVTTHAGLLLVHMLSTAFDIISFNCQEQLCPPTCAEWIDLSNHSRISTIQSRTPEKKEKKPFNFDLKICMKILFHVTHLPFLSSNPKILKAFLKTFATKMKPTKCPAREKKMRHEKQKKRRGEKEKSTSKDCCVTFEPKKSRNFACCTCPNFASCYFASGSEGREVQDL